MKRSSYLLVVLGTALAASTTYGTMIATEYFNDYGTTAVNLNPAGGTGLSGGSGWDGGWKGNGDDWAEYTPGAGLTWNQPGYYNDQNQTGADDGAAVSFQGTGRTIPYRLLDNTSETTIWASALISIDDATDRAVLWLDYGGSGNDFAGVLDGNIYFRYNNQSSQYGAPTTGTHMILTKTVMNASGNNDSLSFWFDPDLSGGESGLGAPTASGSNADTFGTSFGAMGMMISQQGSASAGNETLDSLLIGTTYTDVIPEPATMGLIGFSGLGLLLARRFLLL